MLTLGQKPDSVPVEIDEPIVRGYRTQAHRYCERHDMKDRGILHPPLARVVAEMGHGDLLAIGDAGLPVPLGVERVDLAFAPGKPGFLEVVTAVVEELRVEAYVVAEESRDACPAIVQAIEDALPNAEAIWLPSHDELKRMSQSARAVVRTGEFTSYANVLLRSGVNFDRS